MRIPLLILFVFAILTLWVPVWWPVAVFQVGVFALAVTAVFRAPSLARAFRYPLLPLCLAVGWGLLQRFTGKSAYAFATEEAIVRWATFLAVYLAAVLALSHDHDRRWFRLAMLWFAFAVAVLAILQSFTSTDKVFWLFPVEGNASVMGPILYHNHYAVFVEAVLPIAVYQSLKAEGQALLYGAVAAVLYGSVIACASRSGAILTTFEILAVFLLVWAGGRNQGRRIGAVGLQMLLLFTVLGAVVGWGKLGTRFLLPDPMTGRREFNISSGRMIADHPWFGVGLGAWPTVYPSYAIIDVGAFANQAHDDWAQWTAEGGFPFLAFIASLFLWSIRPAIRSIWGIGVVAVFLHAFVDYPFSRPALGSWTILIVSMLAARAPAGGDTEELPVRRSC